MQVIEHYNPFDLSEFEVFEIEAANGRLWEAFVDWYDSRYTGTENRVEHVLLNGTPQRMPIDKRWPPVVILDNSEIRIVMRVGDPFTIIAVTLSVLSIASVTLMPTPKGPQGDSISPTYSLQAQQNQARPGAPIPIHYGRVRVWPDLAAPGYNNYINDEQYLYQLFCIGAGEFSFETLQIEDTDVDNFDDITYEYYYNAPVTLFPTAVTTSGEVANQVLEYDNNTGPFNVNASGTEINRIEVDLVWPSGLFRARDDGDISLEICSLAIEYQEIDGSSNPVPSPAVFTTLFSGLVQRVQRSPVRITFGADVPAGRYRVQVRRGDEDINGPVRFNRVQWEALRGYHEDDAITYTGKTMLAIRAKATSNLSGSSQRRFNVVATRKVPIYTGSPLAWTAVTATSEIAWALADVVRNDYGIGQVDARLDLTQLLALDAIWQARGDEFNFRFDTPVTAWEALTVIARAGRAFPVRNNNIISFVRSSALSTPTALFNRRNMVLDTVKVEYNLNEEETHDAISARFIDPANNWKENTVLCQPPTSSAANPKQVLYRGVTTKGQAYREGVYEAEALLKQRKAIVFETELEGLIPQKGDLIIVADEDFNLDGGSELVAVSGTVLTPQERPDWTDSSPETVHAIRLRKPNGDVDGPYTVTRGSPDTQMILTAPLSWTPDTDGDTTRTIFQFGTISSVLSQWVISKIRPLGGNKVSIRALNYVASVHTVDTGSPPADNNPAVIATSDDAPVIAHLILENTTNPAIIRASWSPAPGATEYVVEMAFDASPLEFHHVATITRNQLDIPTTTGVVYIRVAAIGRARGPWKTDSLTAKSYSETSPTGVTATASLVLTTTGDYQTNITLSFTPVGDDYLVVGYEAQYQLARHNGAWQPLFYGKENSFEFRTSEIGQHQFRVRSVYVRSQGSPETVVASDWAETSITNLGTYTSIASVGLPTPESPTLFITADESQELAEIRVRVGYSQGSPETAIPDAFVIFYSAEERPNQLGILTDNGSDKLYLDPSNADTGIAGSFTLLVGAGSTDDVIIYSDPSGAIDIDLSGVWWVNVSSNASPDLGDTRYFKVFEASATEIKLAPGDELPFVPQAGDTINILELDWHDARLAEFKLAYINGEVIKHSGLDYDGQYYLEAVTRGAEGTTQADQSGQTADYFPALGPDTYAIVIDMAEFQTDSDGNLVYAGTIDLRLPGQFSWAAVSCAFFRRGTTSSNAQYARSNIVPLVIGGPA